MNLSRRDFLKVSGITAATFAVTELGFDVSSVEASSAELKIAYAKATPTICPYCSCGCGILVYTDQAGQVIGTEGDPDHPINRGSLCSKGSAVMQINSDKPGQINKNRLTRPLYRAPGSDHFEAKSWDWVMNRIVEKVKETRDKSFVHKSGDMIVNYTEAIASLGGAALDNEEGYLQQKMMRALGLLYIEHQARI